MLVKLADKQVITAPAPNASVIYSDPVELGRFNRGAAILVVQYVHGDMTFHYRVQVSNDLETWTEDGPAGSFTGPTPPPPTQNTGTLNGRYARAHMWLDGGTAGTTGHICVDLKLRLDVEAFEL